MSLMHDNFRSCLEVGDVEGCREIMGKVNPHLPQPDYVEAEKTMHITRTEVNFVSFRARAYSHRWLLERGLPSNLPDELKPKAERLYPQIVAGVGISVNTNSPVLKPAASLISKVMHEAVAELHADGVDLSSTLVKTRMMEAKNREMKRLFGRIK